MAALASLLSGVMLRGLKKKPPAFNVAHTVFRAAGCVPHPQPCVHRDAGDRFPRCRPRGQRDTSDCSSGSSWLNRAAAPSLGYFSQLAAFPTTSKTRLIKSGLSRGLRVRASPGSCSGERRSGSHTPFWFLIRRGNTSSPSVEWRALRHRERCGARNFSGESTRCLGSRIGRVREDSRHLTSAPHRWRTF
jgi:hypothetical protein